MNLESVLYGVFMCVLLTSHCAADNLPTCQPKDFHYEYTECDSSGGRWRVSVPKPNACVGGAPNPPIRGKDCKFTCKEGTFLDINGKQVCQACPAGTYSLGGGIRFADWDHMPAGFSVTTKTFITSVSSFAHISSDSSSSNCTKDGWTISKRMMASYPSQCQSSLTFSANLVKAGSVRFTYQYTDDNTIFKFLVQNDQCQTYDDQDKNKWIDTTEKNEWGSITVDLKSGVNVLEWRTIGVRGASSTKRDPVLIKSIEISGVAFTSECTKCRPGTWSKPGATFCKKCPVNTYSGPGANVCANCNAAIEFSAQGSPNCTKRPACSAKDYFDFDTPCDANKQTQKVYKWIEPKICREDLPKAAKLPPAGKQVACPPCNPGMHFVNGTCEFCPPDFFSESGKDCQKCPVSTAPKYGIVYKWWNTLPPNVTTSCLSVHDRGCVTKTGWQPAGDHMYSGKGHSDDAYLVMTLKVAGFRGNSNPGVAVGELSFVFELDCKSACQLFLMAQSATVGTSVVKSWTGKQAKQKYTYEVKHSEHITFTWAFQKESWESTVGESQYTMVDDAAKIYSIEVTNTMEGGAATCKKCPRGSSQNGCIPCPAGHYIRRNDTQCIECPENTIIKGRDPWGANSCKPCGEGLTAVAHEYCTSSCHYKSPQGRQYDFSKVKGVHQVTGSHLFTSSGTQYYHLFNISLCGDGEKGVMKPMCLNNLTAEIQTQNTSKNASHSHGAMMKNRLLGPNSEESVHALICRATIVPPVGGPNGFSEKPISAQPVSLADTLVRVTTNGSHFGINQKMLHEGFDVDEDGLDVHFQYSSDIPTQACMKGRTTIITMRCDVSEKGKGRIRVPPQCPDGTCDGCNFHFLWSTRLACPMCNAAEYEQVSGECINGWRTITRIPPVHCILLEDSKSRKKKVRCPDFKFWLAVAGICVGFSGTLMCALLCYCWKKNKKLEYKYSKLIVNSSGKEGELPMAETCALDDEDDDEQFDAVRFKESRGKKFFNKLKSIGKKDANPFETIQLTDKSNM